MSNVQLARDIYAAFGRGDAGEHVVMEGRYTGTYKPSGRSVDAQVCHVLRFREGRLLSFQQYLDTGQLQAVMATS